MPLKPRFITLLTFAFLNILLLNPLLAEDNRLKISTVQHAWGSSCQDNPLTIVAGCQCFLRITNKADEPIQPLVQGWPEGYELEAALDLPANQAFISTPNLIDVFHPTRYIGQLNRMEEKRVLKFPDATVHPQMLNSKEIVMTVPATLAGHSIAFRVHYRRGTIDLTSPPTVTIGIVAPCDKADTARIFATQIVEAYEKLEYGKVFFLADSMITCGLTNNVAWDCAFNAARGSSLYDRAVKYLDRAYADYGFVGTSQGLAEQNYNGEHTAEDEAAYQKMRNDLLELQSKQQQR